jgi:hypothetical protein
MDTEIKSSHTGSLTHGKVVHALKRRVRIISPVLLKDPEKACVLEILPQKRDDIEKVSTAPDIASVVIYFDSNKLSKVTLSILLDTLLANLCTKENSQLLSINLRKWSLFRAISAFPSVPPVDRLSNPRVHSLVLGGMALLISKQNLFRALGYNMVTIPVTAMDKINPMIASVAMTFSSISVVLNSLHLQHKQE